MKERLVNAISDMQEQEAINIARQMLDAGTDPQVVLDGEVVIEGELLRHVADVAPDLLRFISHVYVSYKGSS